MIANGLDYLKTFSQFIVYRLEPREGSRKSDKIPVDPNTGTVKIDPHDPANWLSYEQAMVRSQALNTPTVLATKIRYGVGWVITAASKIGCLDIDEALITKDGVKQWHHIVGTLCALLPGAAQELSVSGEGLHLWFRYEGDRPLHKCTKKVDGIKIELFTDKRFIALGSHVFTGNAGADCTAALQTVITTYFPASGTLDEHTGEWTTEHCKGWVLPDDTVLIDKALSSKVSETEAFNGAPHVGDLWKRNVPVLAKAYPPGGNHRDFDESEADFALAQKLGFWTGNNHEHIRSLMLQSSLVRPKWTDRNGEKYLRRTISNAIAHRAEKGDYDTCYDPKRKGESAVPAPPPTAYVPDATVAEMAAIAQSSAKDEAISLMMQLGTQDSIATAFATLYAGKLKFDHSRKVWHIWDGICWREDDKKRVFDLVVNLCREKNREGKSSMGSASFAHGVEDIASSRPGLAVSGNEWNRDNYLLNTPAGTYDLRTGKLRPHGSDDMLTKCTGASPDTASDGAAFRKFMTEITAGDEELIRFHQVSLGACLSGAVEDHWILFWTGVGRNGKNTLGELVPDVMGDYAKKIEASTLMSKKFKVHSEEIANLHGCRLAVSSELNDGDHWDEARINEVTGDADLSARYLYGNRFQFKRTHKHLVYANYKPQLRSVSDGIRSRLKIVPFKISFLNREDKNLPRRLRDEMGYVLQWLIEGHRLWLDAGRKLPRCAAVEAESADYFEKQSTPQLWLKERCEVRYELADLQLPTIMELYGDYKNWKVSRGELAVNKGRWEEQALQGFQKVVTRKGTCVRGIRLRLPFDLPAPPASPMGESFAEFAAKEFSVN